MAFDRNKYKASKSLQDQQKELVESGKIRTESGTTPDYFEIKKDGEYYLRFWPAHLNEVGKPTSYFMLLRKQHFLTVMKDKYVDGKLETDQHGNPAQILGKTTIFNSVVHGGTKKDIIDEYIAFVRQLGMDMYPEDKEGYKKYMKHIYGHGNGKNFVGGITGNEEYIAYASLINKDTMKEESFTRVILKPSMRKGMLKISSTEDGSEGITTDPFTDPDDGFIVKIKRDSVAAQQANDPSLYYDISFYTKNYVPVKWPLPEDFPDRFEKMPSLSSLYENKYTVKDFQRAIEGLERFDKEHGYNAFSHDSWLDICQEIASYYPDEDDSSQETATTHQSTSTNQESTSIEEATVVQEEIPFEVRSEVSTSTSTLSPAEKLKQMKEAAAGRAAAAK